ncbi:hypothetical protein [Caproicibacterium sp. XB2]
MKFKGIIEAIESSKSLPTRERGLKSRGDRGRTASAGRSLHGSVD